MNRDIGTTEDTVLTGGHTRLSGRELEQKLVGNTITGEFGFLFKYVMTVKDDGTLEGKNNAGAHHFGRYSIDTDENTISVEWDSGWVNTTSRAYEADGAIKLFNIETGKWETTFTDFKPGCSAPLIAPQ